MKKNALAAVSVFGLLGASGFVAWSVLSRPDDAPLTSEAAQSFDLKSAPPSAPRAAPPPVSEEMRDAVAAPVSPRPIPYAGMAVLRSAPPPAAKPAERSIVTPKLEEGTRRHRLFAALLRAPAHFLASRSAAGSPRALRAFLADKNGVDAFMNSTIVRVVLASPAVAKSVLGRPALVRAFLSSPAMQDPDAVRALLSSRMVAKMLDCPGVQEALADPAVIQGIVAEPETLRWLGENPGALNALASAAPALAQSLGAARR